MPASDLQSLLLAVSTARAATVRPADLLRRYDEDRFVRPSTRSPRVLADLERQVHRALPDDFELVTLSPVAPLGSVAAVSTVAQNSLVSTGRGSEVVSDVTNVLALECAARRRVLLADRATRHQRVRLAAVHRVLRGQVWDAPGFSAHFSLLGLCTAGRDEGSFRFESETLRAHLRFYVRLLQGPEGRGPALGTTRILLTPIDRDRSDSLERFVVLPLAQEFPDLRIALDDQRERALDYYVSACLDVSFETADGELIGLADGGFTDWTQQILSNRKERLLISGMGLERVADIGRAEPVFDRLP